jgi:hypothetical protein
MDPEEEELLLTEDVGEEEIGDIDEDAGEEEIGFGEEAEDEGDPADLPKRLRNEIRERDRAIAALSRRAADAEERAKPVPVEVGARPRLEDFDYDEEKFDAAVDEWSDRKVQAQLAQRQQPTSAEDEARQDVQRYEASVSGLTFSDASEVISDVRASLTPQQEYMIASVSADAGKLLYALGRNPSKLRELVGVTNPAKFIAKVALMEASMTVRKKSAPNPERIPQGNAMPKGADKELARLEKEAERTGNRTALIAYRRKLREAA